MILACLVVGWIPCWFSWTASKSLSKFVHPSMRRLSFTGFFFVFSSLPFYLYGSYMNIFFGCFLPNSARILPCTITPGPFVIPKHTSRLLDLRCNFLQLYFQRYSWKDARTHVTPFQNLFILHVWYSFLCLSVYGQYCIWIPRTRCVQPVFFLHYFNKLSEIFTIIAFNFLHTRIFNYRFHYFHKSN